MALTVSPPVTRTLTTDHLNWQQFAYYTPWYPTLAFSRVSGLIERVDTTADFRVGAVMQLAKTNPNGDGSGNPTQPTTFGASNSLAGDGIYRINMLDPTTVDAQFYDYYWVRFGVVARTWNSGTWSSGDVTATFFGTSND